MIQNLSQKKRAKRAKVDDDTLTFFAISCACFAATNNTATESTEEEKTFLKSTLPLDNTVNLTTTHTHTHTEYTAGQKLKNEEETQKTFATDKQPSKIKGTT